ncbi:excinuclease ABC subunit C [Haladaptatus caseinilyticus]|uniref:excinuclease ABC subunit C n=1 Tax=Haladaptatus caseinilyticus TaxID=2993314 RepID=UPI00224A9ED0|nr:excinuclease ABC subunit C [Haladaptatus caseinilyticus]
MDAATVRERAKELPREPGVYQFLEGDTVRYVGKAVDLRARVRSYADPRSNRIGRMVERADALDFAVTDTETQALLLEANLIKRYQPRYNVRLKDDKSYPLVQVTGHEFPQIEITRDPNREGATVFGPFTNKSHVETVVKALRETYGIRGCSDYKFANRDRPCLDYDIGLCTAPCTNEIGREAYLGDVKSVERFLGGETDVLVTPLRREMESAAQNREFERAANLRDRLEAVESFHGGDADAISSRTDERTVDVLGASVEGEHATVARLHSERGQLVDRDRHTLSVPDGDDVAAVLGGFIPQFYAERDLPDALLLSERPDDTDVLDWLESEGVAVRVPGAGREATLVDLALKNARRGANAPDELRALADGLSMSAIDRIEGFDVSHAQGSSVVGSNVVFVGGSPEKSDYRRKKLTEKNDDYDNMRALIRWRANRAIGGHDERPDPDLLLIDGGKGQLDAAREALDEIGWDVPAVGLAKAEEIVITPNRTFDWPSDAPQLHVLQRVRDEAHRFAVQYHQTLRDDVSTELDGVRGVGPETRRKLFRRFGSLDGIRSASDDELREITGVGEKTVSAIRDRF